MCSSRLGMDIDVDDSGGSCQCLAKIRCTARRLTSREVLEPVLYGQGLSVLICGTAITSTYLVTRYNADIPITQNFFNYVLLAFVYGALLASKRDQDGNRVYCQILKTTGWKYFLIACADVLANYLIVSAYQYTSLTSVQVLDCFVIPVVIILSWFVLKTRYRIVHFVGVAIALIGVTFMIIADVVLGKSQQGDKPPLGDVMVLIGASCYGISNVGMEYFMKRRAAAHTEVLAMYGLFGSIISGTMVACLERDALVNLKWSLVAIGLLVGYALCMFLLYSLMPIVMKISNAITVNLSILTADLYALFTGIFLFQYTFTPLYVVSFVVIFLSLIIYNSRAPYSAAAEGEENNCRYTAAFSEEDSGSQTSSNTPSEERAMADFNNVHSTD